MNSYIKLLLLLLYRYIYLSFTSLLFILSHTKKLRIHMQLQQSIIILLLKGFWKLNIVLQNNILLNLQNKFAAISRYIRIEQTTHLVFCSMFKKNTIHSHRIGPFSTVALRANLCKGGWGASRKRSHPASDDCYKT